MEKFFIIIVFIFENLLKKNKNPNHLFYLFEWNEAYLVW